jgi:mono/diheme cytochrome c family protein
MIVRPDRKWVFAVALFASIVLGLTHTAPGAGKTVWDGVYTSAQAARGQALYEANCIRCHRTNADSINPESRLKGDDFMERWREDDLDSLFSLIRATMPRVAPGSLSDLTYVDIITYLLQVNGFPAGKEELGVESLSTIRIEGKDGPQPLPNGSLVQMVACLSQTITQDRAIWVLTNASEPMRTRRPKQSTAAEREAAKLLALGPQTFRLQNVDYLTDFLHLRLESYRGHKVHAKGYLVRQPNSQRLDVTLVEMLESSCVP